MGGGWPRIFSKRFLSRFSSQKQSLSDDITESPFLTSSKQRSRAWARFFHLPTRIRDPKLSNPFRFSLPSRSSSSSSSPSSDKGFLAWYLGMLKSRPIITKGISTSLIFTASDLTSQMITMPASSSIDKVRTLRMASYGLIILGPSQHVWFNFVSNCFPKRNTLSTLKKILMGQLILGPCINSVFFAYNAVLQGESGAEIVARLKRDLPTTLLNGVLYWPACDFVMFKYVPVNLHPLYNSTCSYIWTIYLTYMANLKGVSGD